MKIKLSDGAFAIVDKQDAKRTILAGPWHPKRGRYTTYAIHHIYRGTKRTTEMLHRFILRLTASRPMIDHKDRNGLNCKRRNLRKCTGVQNGGNREPNNGLKYKGVQQRSQNSFSARIQVEKKAKVIGSFPTAKLAAMAYDKAAKKMFGKFALVNFPL